MSIFRLIETTAVTAISRAGSLDLASFSGDELILPLVSMTQAAERRAGRAGSLAARRVGARRLPVAPRPFRDDPVVLARSVAADTV